MLRDNRGRSIGKTLQTHLKSHEVGPEPGGSVWADTLVFAIGRRCLCAARTMPPWHRGVVTVLQGAARPCCKETCGRDRIRYHKNVEHYMKHVQMARLGPIFIHNCSHQLWEASGIPPGLQPLSKTYEKQNTAFGFWGSWGQVRCGATAKQVLR